MAHCSLPDLDDLRELLDAVRRWPGVEEPRPGIFYVKRTPFLHFHRDGAGRRWADVRDGRAWGSELDLPRGASSAARKRFLREVQRRYRTTAGALGLAVYGS